MNDTKYPRVNIKDKLSIVTDKHVKEQLKMSNFIYYSFKKDYPDQIIAIKKGLVAEIMLKNTIVPNSFLFKTPNAVRGDNDRMIELYKLGLYSESLLKVVVFDALIKLDNKKD